MRRLLARLRGREDERVAAARSAHAAGSFAEARRILAPVVDEGDASLEVVRGTAELEYLLARARACPNRASRFPSPSPSSTS